MKRTLPAALLFLGTAASAALAADPLLEDARGLFEPIPLVVPAVKGNPVTREKVELGKIRSEALVQRVIELQHLPQPGHGRS